MPCSARCLRNWSGESTAHEVAVARAHQSPHSAPAAPVNLARFVQSALPQRSGSMMRQIGATVCMTGRG